MTHNCGMQAAFAEAADALHPHVTAAAAAAAMTIVFAGSNDNKSLTVAWQVPQQHLRPSKWWPGRFASTSRAPLNILQPRGAQRGPPVHRLYILVDYDFNLCASQLSWKVNLLGSNVAHLPASLQGRCRHGSGYTVLHLEWLKEPSSPQATPIYKAGR